MSRHSDPVRLRHMLDHAREAVALLAGKARADLTKNRLLQWDTVTDDLPRLIREIEAALPSKGEP